MSTRNVGYQVLCEGSSSSLGGEKGFQVHFAKFSIMIFLFRIVPLKLTNRNGNALKKMYEMLPKINEEACTNSPIDIAKALLAEVKKSIISIIN